MRVVGNNYRWRRNLKPNYYCGQYSATVKYSNPNTGYTGEYDLEVEAGNCEVTVIYFPKGGWLDEDHISSEHIDEGGDAEVEDDRGRTFSVHIDK